MTSKNMLEKREANIRPSYWSFQGMQCVLCNMQRQAREFGLDVAQMGADKKSSWPRNCHNTFLPSSQKEFVTKSQDCGKWVDLLTSNLRKLRRKLLGRKGSWQVPLRNLVLMVRHLLLPAIMMTSSFFEVMHLLPLSLLLQELVLP